MILMFFIVILLSGSRLAFAGGLIIRDGSTLTLNGSTLDLNCLDLTIENGGTFDFVSGIIDNGGNLIIDSGGNFIWGTGTFNYCQSTLGTISVNPDPDSLNAPWTLEGTGGYFYGGDGDQTLSSLASGDYTFTWNDVTGWVTPAPNPAVRFLAPGATIQFVATYVELDSDEDGMPDNWEQQYPGWLDPYIKDAAEDKDADGFSNLQEYKAGTDPTDPNSKPGFEAMPWILLLLLDE